jgi:hypothetical protein
MFMPSLHKTFLNMPLCVGDVENSIEWRLRTRKADPKLLEERQKRRRKRRVPLLGRLFTHSLYFKTVEIKL